MSNFQMIVCLLTLAFFVHRCFLNYSRSGEISRNGKGGISVVVAIILWLIVFDHWEKSAAYPNTAPFCILVLFGMSDGVQYFWYVGFLSGIRRRHVEKLRASWQKKVDEITAIRRSRNELNCQAISSGAPVTGLFQAHAEECQLEDATLRILNWKLAHILP